MHLANKFKKNTSPKLASERKDCHRQQYYSLMGDSSLTFFQEFSVCTLKSVK